MGRACTCLVIAKDGFARANDVESVSKWFRHIVEAELKTYRGLVGNEEIHYTGII